tara:strand:- start:61 stop:210 length:150 start_codon:yes stop_codon:yes gene_type:complete
MKKYKVYGGLKYLIHDGKKAVFIFVSYQNEKSKTKKIKKKNRKTKKAKL